MTDVAVFGATGAGVMAAVAAARAGADTVLVEPGRHVGGMVSGGLSWTDVGDTSVLGGFARRFYEAVADRYDAPLWSLRGDIRMYALLWRDRMDAEIERSRALYPHGA